MRCTSCAFEFRSSNGFPVLLSNAPEFKSAQESSAAWDTIYTDHSNVWEDQGRASDFISYFTNLVAARSTGTLLEIGCGEGILLSALKAQHKVAIDISPLALKKTTQRVSADCAVAIAERLPFAAETFDVVVSVGVMEHFLNDGEATREIHRVLKRGGSYVALIHTQSTLGGRISQKIREYVFPRPRPVALLKWIAKKALKPIHQPFKQYSLESGRACMQDAGFEVHQTITYFDKPRAPLAGPHVVIYISRKPAAK